MAIDNGAPGSTAQAWAVDVQGITKLFGNRLVLKGIDLKVREGSFLTIFGPNGSGKTTLIKILATIIRPSSGTARIAGFDLRESPVQVRRRIGVVGHQTFLYGDLTALENLKFYGRMYDVPNLEKRIQEVAAMVALGHRLHHKVHILSRGMQQRFSIARTILHRPLVVFLDEPETGLDQQATGKLREVLAALSAEGGTVIMTTHRLEYGLEMADQVAILTGGRIAYQESTSSLDMDSLRQTYHRLTSAT